MTLTDQELPEAPPKNSPQEREMRTHMTKACRDHPPIPADPATAFGSLMAHVHTTFEVLSSTKQPFYRTYVARTPAQRTIMNLLIEQGIMHREGPVAAHFNGPYQRPKALKPAHVSRVLASMTDYRDALLRLHQFNGSTNSNEYKSLHKAAEDIRADIGIYLTHIEREQ